MLNFMFYIFYHNFFKKEGEQLDVLLARLDPGIKAISLGFWPSHSHIFILFFV